MKKIYLFAFLAMGSIAARAQATIAKGTFLLSGSVGYHSITDEQSIPASSYSGAFTSTVTTGTFKIDAIAGGFVANNVALGLQLTHAVTGGTAKTTSNYNLSSPPTSSALRVGPVVQYYKMLGEQFALTATLGAGYESDTRYLTQYYTTSNGYPYYSYIGQKATGYYAALTPGIVFFPIPKFGLSAIIGALGYNRLTVKSDTQNNSNQGEETLSGIDAGFGFSQLQFGGTHYFGR